MIMRKRKNGILGTFIFHGVILLIVAIFGFSTPLPLPAEEGILVNFGTDLAGSGDTEPRFTETGDMEILPQQQESPPVIQEEETEMTQDFEEAPSIDTDPLDETATEQEQEAVNEEVTETTGEVVPEPLEETREVNERALYKGRADSNNTDEGEGITEGDGNQGSPTGSPDSDNYSNVLSQGGGGVTWNLEGRNPVSLPKPEYKYQVEGTVVVRIRVDRNGKVISAEAGVRGSNTTDTRLLEAARDAALKARFDSNTTAAIQQQGTLTYRFILQ